MPEGETVQNFGDPFFGTIPPLQPAVTVDTKAPYSMRLSVLTPSPLYIDWCIGSECAVSRAANYRRGSALVLRKQGWSYCGVALQEGAGSVRSARVGH